MSFFKLCILFLIKINKLQFMLNHNDVHLNFLQIFLNIKDNTSSWHYNQNVSKANHYPFFIYITNNLIKLNHQAFVATLMS